MGNYRKNKDEHRNERLTELFIDHIEKGIACEFSDSEWQEIILYLMVACEKKYCKLAIYQAIATFPDDDSFKVLLGKFFILNHQFEEAGKILHFVETHFPPSAGLYFEQAILSFFEDETHKSTLELFKKSLALDNVNPEAHIFCTYEYLRRGQLDKAVSHAKKALENYPNFAEELKMLILEHCVRPIDASLLIRFYRQLVDDFPMSVCLWNSLGIAYSLHKDNQDAIEAFQYQATLALNDPTAYYNIGKCYLNLEDYENALKHFEIANSKNGCHLYDSIVGHCYFMMQEYDKALPLLLKASPDSEDYAMALGDTVYIFLNVRDNFEGAYCFLKKKFNAVPESYDNLEELLNLLDPDKDFEEMCSLCLKHIESIGKENIEEFFFLFVSFCCEVDYFKLGIAICQKYVDEPLISNSMGYYMAALHILDENIEVGCTYLENAILLSPDNCMEDFVNMDYRLGFSPKVQEILEKNNDIIYHDLNFGFNPPDNDDDDDFDDE